MVSALNESDVSSYATTCFQRTFRPHTKKVIAWVASWFFSFSPSISFDGDLTGDLDLGRFESGICRSVSRDCRPGKKSIWNS